MLWSKMEMKETAKAQLAAAVGSKSVSDYRITTSGMLGIDRENETSPLFSVANSARIDITMATAVQDLVAPDQSTIDAVLSKSAAFIDSSAVLVLCGDPSSKCKSLDVLANKDRKVIPLWTCPSLNTDASHEEMTLCKEDTLRALMNEKTRFKGIVIDSKTPRIMGQIFHNLFTIPRVRRQFLEEHHVIVFASEGNDAQWRRALLDRFRTNPSSYDPSYRAEVTFDGTDLELGIFWTQGDGFYSQLVDVLNGIEAETGLTANVQHVRNAANNKYYADFEPSYYASHNDYNYTKALEQYKSQQCLAKQTLSQYESKSDSFNATALQKALHATFLEMTTANDDEEMELFQSVGDGCIVVIVWSFGRVVLTWDGKQKVNLNIMTGENDADHQKVANLFASKSKSKLTAYDTMPRGIGRVVNFASDYESVKKPHWAEFVQ
jgi:S-adenosylmethionine/arginine decarboxylase-like enzyme